VSRESWSQALKRFIDVIVAGIGLLVAAPLLVAIALVIKLQDGGPVLFKQARIGRDGRPFTIYKFRSMVTDAEMLKAALLDRNEGAGHLFKMKSDPRVTPLGRILRRFSLDELPQLLNILDGSMSLVGPRPHLAEEVARLPHDAQRRSLVRPGLTGLWQVSGRSSLDETESLRLDLSYVDNWSLTLDWSILRRTVAVVLTSQGAH